AWAGTGKYPGLSEIQEAARLAAVVQGASGSFEFLTRFVENKEDLLNNSRDFADIVAFYTRQRVQWDELCTALDRFEINRLDLEKDEAARQALSRMREIRIAPAPYGIIKEATALIRTVEAVNDGLLKGARDLVSSRVYGLVEQLGKDVAGNGITGEAIEKSQSLLRSLAERVKNEPSIANVRRYEDEAKEVFEHEVNRLFKTATGGKAPEKEIKTVQVKNLTRKSYLETEQDVDDYSDAVRQELKKLIKDGKRVRIE
ncbi:MAG: hypothetical protein HQL22_12800, partial [Candidatus Omnitrophica bacterium]|nr:hypothetical protein [Candidatus Omnitrophota bacterium]